MSNARKDTRPGGRDPHEDEGVTDIGEPEAQEETEALALWPAPMTFGEKARYFGYVALGTSGITELVLRMGGAGLLAALAAGGLAAYWSEEIRESILDKLPAPRRARSSRCGKLSWWLTGQVPKDPDPQEEAEEAAADAPREAPRQPEPEPPSSRTTPDRRSGTALAPVQPPQPSVRLCDQGAPDELLSLGYVLPSGTPLRVHVNRFLGEGVFVAGNMGAGKTNLAALLAEQMGACYVPSIIFDLKREYASLPGVLSTAIRVGHPDYAEQAGPGFRYLTCENAAEVVAEVMSQGYQAVVDLLSYTSIDLMGLIIAEVIDHLMAWSRQQPQEQRPPCFVFLDEAHHFVPQQANLTQLDRNISIRLQKSLFAICNLGRSYGYTMAFCTQRIANIAKWVIANCQIKIIMKHGLDIDLDRCTDEVNKAVATRETIQQLAPGQGIVIGLTDQQFLAQFHPRRSSHASHTPKVERAHQRYRDHHHLHQPTWTEAQPHPLPGLAGAGEQDRGAPSSWPVTPMPDLPRRSGSLTPASQPSGTPAPTVSRLKVTLSPELQRAYDAFRDGMSHRDLGRVLGVSHATAGKYIQRLKDMGLIDAHNRKRPLG